MRRVFLNAYSSLHIGPTTTHDDAAELLIKCFTLFDDESQSSCSKCARTVAVAASQRVLALYAQSV